MIGIPCLFGYSVRCGRSILKGDDRLPEWRLSDDLFADGIKVFVISLLYGIVSFVITYVVHYFFPFSTKGLPLVNFLVVTQADALLQTIITLPVILMTQISLMIFIDKGDLGMAIDPRNSYRLMVARPLEFIEAEVMVYIVGLIFYLPLFIMGWYTLETLPDLSRGCGLCLLMLPVFGLIFYITTCVNRFIWAKFYRMATGANAVRPADVPPYTPL